MKVTLVQQCPGWILMRIETNISCIQIDLTSTFSPFKEMYTWLGCIRDRQLPAEMIINEEGYNVILIANLITENSLEFFIKDWSGDQNKIYLKTIVDFDILIASFQNEIIKFISKQYDEAEPSFIVDYESFNWDSLLETNRTQDWHKRLAIYGGGEYKYKETNLDNFSLTLKQKYLVELYKGLQKISWLSYKKANKELSKLVSFYQELAVDIALDAIDPDWYEREKEKLNTKYKINDCWKWRTGQERLKENEKLRNLRQARLKTLQIGQIVDGTVVGFRPYGVFVDIGGIYTLLHISKISRSPIENPQQVFKLNDWVRAIIFDFDVERGRVALSTKDLESEPGQMFIEPWMVYQNAEIMAEKYKQTILNSSF